jgi:hypothetical protein
VLVGSAIMLGGGATVSIGWPTMYASARMLRVANDLYDPLSLLIVSKGRKLVYSGLQGYGSDGYAVGDVD